METIGNKLLQDSLVAATRGETGAAQKTNEPRQPLVPPALEETPAVQLRGQTQLSDAIDATEMQEKEAYLKALQVCPQLVERETPALWFLRYEHYDGWAAAKRLAYYWRRRVDIFGERAFLPMSQTGHGTLSPEEVKMLRSGYLVILPPTPDGHTILCYDASRLDGDNRQARLRCFFYFASVLMEEEINRNDGVIFLGIMRNLTLARSFGLNDPALVVEHAVPISARSMHAVRCKTSLPLLKFTLPFLIKYISKAMKRIHFHLGNDKQVLQSMESTGLPASILPAQIGGSWTYDRFEEWCNDRCQFEMERFPSLKLATAVSQRLVHVQDKKVDRRRQLRVMYSRQKRKRQKDMLNNLHEQVFDLKNEERSLREENTRLEQLVVRASVAIELYHQEAMKGPQPSSFAPSIISLKRRNVSGTAVQDSHTYTPSDSSVHCLSRPANQG